MVYLPCRIPALLFVFDEQEPFHDHDANPLTWHAGCNVLAGEKVILQKFKEVRFMLCVVFFELMILSPNFDYFVGLLFSCPLWSRIRLCDTPADGSRGQETREAQTRLTRSQLAAVVNFQNNIYLRDVRNSYSRAHNSCSGL